MSKTGKGALVGLLAGPVIGFMAVTAAFSAADNVDVANYAFIPGLLLGVPAGCLIGPAVGAAVGFVMGLQGRAALLGWSALALAALAAVITPVLVASHMEASKRHPPPPPSEGEAFAAGDFPSDIAFDGACMWIANLTACSVTKVSCADGSTVGTYSVGGRTDVIVFDGRCIWARAGGSVVRMGLDGSVLGRYGVGGDPCDMVFDGTYV